jgi:hypothetical protein
VAKKVAAASKKTTGTVAASAVAEVPEKATKTVSVVVPKNAAVSAEQAPPPMRSASAPRPEPTHEEIAHRAYQLWTQGIPGGPADHWLQAERELRHT